MLELSQLARGTQIVFTKGHYAGRKASITKLMARKVGLEIEGGNRIVLTPENVRTMAELANKQRADRPAGGESPPPLPVLPRLIEPPVLDEASYARAHGDKSLQVSREKMLRLLTQLGGPQYYDDFIESALQLTNEEAMKLWHLTSKVDLRALRVYFGIPNKHNYRTSDATLKLTPWTPSPPQVETFKMQIPVQTTVSTVGLRADDLVDQLVNELDTATTRLATIQAECDTLNERVHALRKLLQTYGKAV